MKKIQRFRQRFLDKFIENRLTPKEEIFVLCNTYAKSKQIRNAAIYSETDEKYRHTLDREFNRLEGYFKYRYTKTKSLERHPDEDFGNKKREFIYRLLHRADKFPK